MASQDYSWQKQLAVWSLVVIAVVVIAVSFKFILFPDDNVVIIARSRLKNKNQSSSLADLEAAEASLFAASASRYFRDEDQWKIIPLQRLDPNYSDGDQILLRNTIDQYSGVVNLVELKTGRRLIVSVTVSSDLTQLECRVKVPH